MQKRCSYSWDRLPHPRGPQCSVLPIPGVIAGAGPVTTLPCYPAIRLATLVAHYQRYEIGRVLPWAGHLNQGSSWAVLVVNIYMPSNYQGALPCLRFTNGILGQLLKIPMLTIPFISEFITAIIVSNILRETKGKYFPVASFIICVHTDPLVAGQWPNIVKTKWATRTHV